MSDVKLKYEDCISLLRDKHTELTCTGENRYPCRSDFSEREVVAIKAFLGPWPRALEAAGIKAPRDDDRKQKNKEKRARAKRNRNLQMRMQEKARKESENAAQTSVHSHKTDV